MLCKVLKRMLTPGRAEVIMQWVVRDFSFRPCVLRNGIKADTEFWY